MDRAQVLAQAADQVMRDKGRVPVGIPEGFTSFMVEVWPEFPERPREIRFTGHIAGQVLVCSRPFRGWGNEPD